MSEAIQTELSPYPGEAWTEIVRRPTLEEFSRAFASDVVLEAAYGVFPGDPCNVRPDRFHPRNRHEGENVPGVGMGLRRQSGGRRHHHYTGRPRGDHERATTSSPQEWSQQNGTAINARGGTSRRPPSLRASRNVPTRFIENIKLSSSRLNNVTLMQNFGWCPTLVGKIRRSGRAACALSEKLHK